MICLRNADMVKRYRYPNSDKVFELIEIRGFIYKFKCGHWCTDSVFTDLVDVETGIPNWMQPRLF